MYKSNFYLRFSDFYERLNQLRSKLILSIDYEMVKRITRHSLPRLPELDVVFFTENDCCDWVIDNQHAIRFFIAQTNNANSLNLQFDLMLSAAKQLKTNAQTITLF